MAILFEDRFDGTGTLLAHVSDSGAGWVNVFEGGTLDVGGGVVYQRPGYSVFTSQAKVAEPLFVSGTVEIVVELEVMPGSVTGTVSAGAALGNDDGGLGFTVNVGNAGYCVVASDGLGAPASVVLSSGSESATRTHTIRIVGIVGSSAASLYANGVLVGPFTLYAPLGTDLSVLLLLSPNRTAGNTPLVGVSSVVVQGEGPVVGEFWTNIIRAAETP
ncbi:hypothetical protein [Pseudomonas sp. C11]|uniref:hypothetical protein n=1 Tax=Pseudomonas sp. C11 TaxID=3075550 RepID=UPI002AFE9E04|nr:hypothetical protein [Pseudomonas sp. C11]